MTLRALALKFELKLTAVLAFDVLHTVVFAASLIF